MQQRIIHAILSSPVSLSVAIYFRAQGITLKPWQFSNFLRCLSRRNSMKNWGRGMSKTFMDSHFSVYTGLFRLATAYCVPRQDQFDQAKKYFDNNPFVETNPHTRGAKNFGQWYKILDNKLIKLINIDDKGFNVSSGRFNNVILDESALLMYFAKEIEIYNKAMGMMKSLPYQHLLIDSTPLLGSHFYNIKEDWEVHDPGAVSWHNFQNTPDNFVSDTQEKLDNLMNELAEQKRMGTEWNWECENLAVPRVPGGTPFPNVIWGKYTIPKTAFIDPKSLGLDFHEHVIGHIGVEWWWSPMTPSRVYATREFANQYDALDTGEESVSFLAEPYYKRIRRKRAEEFGFNSGFYKDARAHGVKSFDITGNKKHNTIYNFKQFHVYIDPLITPYLAQDIKNAMWVDAVIFKIMKKATGPKYRNHYLDAGLIGLPYAKGNEGFVNTGDDPFHDDGAGGLINRQKRAGVWKGRNR